MFQKRSLTTGFLVTSLGIAAGLAVLSSPDVAVGADCKQKDAAVKKHCEDGGQAAVKKAMKSAVDAANAAGEKIDGKKVECKNCHENTTDFKLTSDGEKLFGAHLKKYYK